VAKILAKLDLYGPDGTISPETLWRSQHTKAREKYKDHARVVLEWIDSWEVWEGPDDPS
jgi:hypothetical protein